MLLLIRRLATVAAVLLASASSATEAPKEPVKVFIGVHVVDLRSVDVRAQSFSADFYVWLRFKADGMDEARIAAVSNLEPVNGKFDSKELIDDKLVGDEKYLCYRVTGTFFFVPDLRNYPFDKQTLPITLESTSLEVDEVQFVDDRASYERSGGKEDRWGLSPTLFVPDYFFLNVHRRVFEGSYPTDFGDPSKVKSGTRYTRFAIEPAFEREYWSYAFKILIPLLIILAMAYLVFFLPPDQLDTAASVAMTALLSCMAYNVAVTQNMPEIGYLVLSDKFFIATYVLLLLTLGQTFLSFKLDASGHPRARAEGRQDRAHRVPDSGGGHLPLLHLGRVMHLLVVMAVLAQPVDVTAEAPDAGEALVADAGVVESADGGEGEDEPDDWAHGDHLTGEWGGARGWLGAHGFTFDLVYAAEVFGVAPPTGDAPALANGHLDVAVTIDFEAMGLWKGGKFYVLGQNNHGTGINAVVGSVTEISNIEATPYTQLGEFFYEQNLFDVVRFRLGKQDANREFGTPRFGGNFINNNFGMLPSSPLPSYPTNGLGAVVVVNPVRWLTVKASLFEGKPQVGSVGFDSAFVKDAGHFIISSINSTHRFGREGRNNGTTTVGFFRQQGQFEALNPSGASPRTFNELWGLFAQHDERIYLNDDLNDPRCFTIIPRLGWAQPDRFNMSLFLGASLAFHGIGMREDDTVGIGFGYFTVNKQANGTPGQGSEFFVEAFYKFRITKFMSLQPDVQYYRTPGGDGKDALLVGTRLKFKL